MESRLLMIEAEQSLDVFNALGSETRLSILKLLNDRQMNVNEIAEELKLPQSTVSTNITILEKVGLITVCGDTDVSTADPIVHSFKTTAQFTKLNWIGAVQASAGAKGEIARNEAAKKQAYELGKRAVMK